MNDLMENYLDEAVYYADEMEDYVGNVHESISESVEGGESLESADVDWSYGFVLYKEMLDLSVKVLGLYEETGEGDTMPELEPLREGMRDYEDSLFRYLTLKEGLSESEYNGLGALLVEEDVGVPEGVDSEILGRDTEILGDEQFIE